MALISKIDPITGEKFYYDSTKGVKYPAYQSEGANQSFQTGGLEGLVNYGSTLQPEIWTDPAQEAFNQGGLTGLVNYGSTLPPVPSPQPDYVPLPDPLVEGEPGYTPPVPSPQPDYVPLPDPLVEGEVGYNPPVTPPVAPPVTSQPAPDYWQQLLDAIKSTTVPTQGSTENYTPSTSTSELSQALQNRGMELLNRPYGYTSEEQQAIYDQAIQQYNINTDQDIRDMEALFQQYGWNQGNTSLGGQAQSSLEDYYGKRALGLSQLSGTVMKDIADRRMVDEQNAIQNALGINSQIYEQARGDFADQLSMLGFEELARNNEFTRGMTLASFQSEEAQRNFLNQQGISDRNTQDYFMKIAQQWQMDLEAQTLANQNLQNLVNYTTQTQEIPATDLLQSQTWLDNFLTDIQRTGITEWANQDDPLQTMLTALATMLAGGTNVNVGGTTVNPGDVNVGAPNVTANAPDMSWLGDLLKSLNIGNVKIPGIDIPGLDLSGIDLSKLFPNLNWGNIGGWDIGSVNDILGIFGQNAVTFSHNGKSWTLGKDQQPKLNSGTGGGGTGYYDSLGQWNEGENPYKGGYFDDKGAWHTGTSPYEYQPEPEDMPEDNTLKDGDVKYENGEKYTYNEKDNAWYPEDKIPGGDVIGPAAIVTWAVNFNKMWEASKKSAKVTEKLTNEVYKSTQTMIDKGVNIAAAKAGIYDSEVNENMPEIVTKLAQDTFMLSDSNGGTNPFMAAYYSANEFFKYVNAGHTDSQLREFLAADLYQILKDDMYEDQIGEQANAVIGTKARTTFIDNIVNMIHAYKNGERFEFDIPDYFKEEKKSAWDILKSTFGGFAQQNIEYYSEHGFTFPESWGG